MFDIKKLHCIGIGGIGISAIARFFKSQDIDVSGSDIVMSDELRDLEKIGVTIFTKQEKDNISSEVDLIVYSPAVPDDNVELIHARKSGIVCKSYPEMLGFIQENYIGIAVSGTNGKTSTTALLGKMLEEGGKDPNVIVGGHVSGWDNNFRFGKGDFFVVEGCEYKRSMMSLSPHIILLTNVEEDHLDYYKDLDDIKDAFKDYILKLSEEDILVYNIDDENVREIEKVMRGRAISFGLGEDASIRAKNIYSKDGKQVFEVSVNGEDVGEIETLLPGLFNVYNILGAIAVSLDVGVNFLDIKKMLQEYKGSWRRFEHLDTSSDTIVISDYAHHPTAVKGTIEAVKTMYPDKKVLALFQPHQKDRTIKLFDDFVESFAGVDELIISEIYEVPGREDAKQKISSKDLVREILERGGVDIVSYTKDLEDLKKKVEKKCKDFDIILFMGAGDIDMVARTLSVVTKK